MLEKYKREFYCRLCQLSYIKGKTFVMSFFLHIIHRLFDRIDKDNNTSISAAELRVLLLGMNINDDDLGKARDVENILVSFDSSEDGRINQDEFVQGMIKLVSDHSDENQDRTKNSGGSTSQV